MQNVMIIHDWEATRRAYDLYQQCIFVMLYYDIYMGWLIAAQFLNDLFTFFLLLYVLLEIEVAPTPVWLRRG